MEEVLLKDFLAKKERGELKLDKFQRRMAMALAPVELTKVADDDYVHFGDVLQITSSTGAVLAGDIEDKDPRPGENACVVTATSMTAPCARNTFLIVKHEGGKFAAAYDAQYDDSLLHYGQKIKIVAFPACTGDAVDAAGGENPLFLRSMPISTTHFAKFSRNQEVALTAKESSATVWTVLTPDPTKRLVSEGLPVVAGAPVLIQHCGTKQNLSCEDKVYSNDFGTELEVSACTATKVNASFRVTGMIEGKPETLSEKLCFDKNFWCFTAGSKVATLPPAPPVKFNVDKVLKKLLLQLNKQGSNGLNGMFKVFGQMDADGSGHLDILEFKRALAYALINVTDEEAVEMLNFFDKDRSGSIDIPMFKATLSAYVDAN